ncbi:uncharacterized protein PHALS_01398 [Plasmopara halstedii]|uniref:Uncharacterized protein n=1 Tax=Plasmopara halstedii TaxID=4781 RepID=A0A0P1AUL6_PLAHL|nr:uncharacterized protein PHALS_01398 [Plasmopara halstedii]CEG45072.1 hypothetical protein PHALS_01398 [Plasmopara halstedii]|eukprot:XP_024581441.1 hypothetical protein PHALS_01398 [Plasmopara halstedii]
MKKIYNLLSNKQLNRIDTRNLRSIQSLPPREAFELPIHQFNRIIHNLSAGESKYLLAHLKDEYGTVRKSISLHKNHFGVQDLAITLDEGLTSDADTGVSEVLAGTVKVKWIPKAKLQRKRSEFFRYLTNYDFKLEDFQV